MKVWASPWEHFKQELVTLRLKSEDEGEDTTT